jgi:hypothetical protein
MFGQRFLDAGMAAATMRENSEVAFKAMIGNAEDTEKTLNSITDFAAATPFEMPQLLQVSQELVTFGERGDGLMDTLKILGDASGGTAPKFQALGLVFNQVRGVGKLLTEDFRQLSTRGIINLKDFVESGIAPSTAAAQEMMTSGKISFDLFRKALEFTTTEGHRNFNRMAEAALTMEGRTSTLNDAIGILGQHVAEASVPFTKFSIDLKIKAVAAMDAFVQSTNGVAGAAFTGAVSSAKLGTTLLGVSLAAKLASVAMKGLGVTMRAAIIGTGVGAAIIAIGAAVGGLVSWFMKTEEVIDATAYFSETLTSAWGDLAEAGGELMSSLSDLIESVLGSTLEEALSGATESIAGWIKWFADKIKEGSEWLKWFSKEIGYWMRNGVDEGKIALIDLNLKIIDVFGGKEVEAWAGGLIGVFEGVKAFFNAWKDDILGGFTEILNLLKAAKASLTASTQAMIEGKGLGAQASAGYDAFMQEFITQEEPEAFKNPLEAFTKARDKAITDVMEGFQEKGLQQTLEDEKKALEEAIALREAQPEGGVEPPDDPDESDGPEEKEKEKEKAEAEATLKAGKFGFAQFGDKIQDSILKKDEGIGKLVDIAGLQHATQQQILTATQENNPGLGP